MDTQRYERKEKYPLEAIFPYIYTRKDAGKLNRIQVFDGDPIRMDSMRYLVFKYVSHKCSKCGLEGVFFAKERSPGQERWHFNLYGIKNNREIMLTKDHIRPKSLGGTNYLINMDCLCEECNMNKSNNWDGKSGI